MLEMIECPTAAGQETATTINVAVSRYPAAFIESGVRDVGASLATTSGKDGMPMIDLNVS